MPDNFDNHEQWLRQPTIPTRNNYFYGKLLDEYHFKLEQAYFNQKRWLLNQFTFGTGILSGLEVTLVNNSGSQVNIAPGIAIDSLGREIIVPQTFTTKDIRQLTDDCGNPTGESIEGEGTILLYLAYRELQSESVRVMAPDCSQDNTCAYSTIQEVFSIVVQKEELSSSFPEGRSKPLPISGTIPGLSLVALAKIHLPKANEFITNASIDLSIRRTIQAKFSSSSPKINQISWQHNGNMFIEDFIHKGLTVTFDQNIHPEGSQMGWFIVTVEYQESQQKVRNITQRFPIIGENRGTVLIKKIAYSDKETDKSPNKITFYPHPDFQYTFSNYISDLQNPLCRVILRCNFLKNDRGQAVDSSLTSQTLTTSGMPGGDFESWFFLTSSSTK
jgi:hypothetical protein